MEQKNMVLRKAMHGADKKQTMERIDALLALVMAVQSGSMFREQALEEARKIAAEPIKTATRGFREEDVQQYMAELIRQI